MTQSSLPILRALLEEVGYRVLFHTSGWSECLVRGPDAHPWQGRGQTEDEALDDAFRKMFPSHASRELFARHVARHPARERSGEARDPEPDAGAARTFIVGAPVERDAPPPPAPALGEGLAPPPTAGADNGYLPEPVLNGVHAPDASVLSLTVAIAEAPAPEATPLESAPPAPSVPSAPPAPPTVAFEAAPAAPPAKQEEAPVAPVVVAPPVEEAPVAPRARPEQVTPAPRSPRQRMADALETVDKQLTAIEEQLPHLARMCGERQRLHMMVWICRARAVEEAHPGMREVEQAVARVARRLTEIGKMFWPGSVRALQLSARPGDVRREMHATWASEPANWREATALAERLLEEHLSKSPESGLDEDGWADAAARTPRPADPDALFTEVDAEIKTLLVPPGEVPNGRAGELSGSDMDALVGASRKLRWVRGAVRDDLAWGVAVGRLRRAVPSLGERGARVRDALDYRTKPPSSWAKLLGELPAEPTAPPGESVDDLKAELPSASVTKEGLLAWLVRAFDVMSTPELGPVLAPLKGEILGFGEDTLNHPDRRVRRRLRDLVKRLQTVEEAPPVKSEPASSEEAPVDEPIAAHALGALATLVRKKTQGRKTLFVSNREDPELGTRLEDLLGIEITWCDGSLRRVQAQCERIKGGSYNLILSATGFQVHGVDSALARAAGTADVPYVRVNRGRPVACVTAIAREFGLVTVEQPTPAVTAKQRTG